jgi:dipeptidyl aminopeptidase/acylaminoacyl peptidase
LHLPTEKVRAIISISGPSDFVEQYHKNKEPGDHKRYNIVGMKDPTLDMVKAPSPSYYVRPDSPPLLCIHSTNDELVPAEQSKIIVKKYHDGGARAELMLFKGKGVYHGIWEDQGGEVNVADRILVPEVTNSVHKFLGGIQ